MARDFLYADEEVNLDELTDSEFVERIKMAMAKGHYKSTWFPRLLEIATKGAAQQKEK